MVGENRFNVFSVFKYLFIIVFSIIILYPLLNVLSVSLSSDVYVLPRKVTFFPRGFTTMWYQKVWTYSGLPQAYINTIKYTSLSAVLAMFVTTTAAYALSKRHRLWGFTVFTNMIIFTMYFGGGLIPSYLTYSAYGLYNTTALIVILGCCSGYNLILMKTFFQGLPSELEDSGKIDGLNDMGVLWHIMLPISTPVMATISLFYAVGNWNAYMTPFIYLRDKSRWPVQVLLRNLLLMQGASQQLDFGGNTPRESLVNAIIVVSILPMIVLFPFLQKFFAKGVMLGAVKG